MSNKYLLLRNNKQNGPFSLDEIREMNLKAYDLVWVEGKSAAWRYPGEIEELKSFAPPVEEQPFDRFFRKASPQTEPVSAEIAESGTPSAAAAKIPDISLPKEENRKKEEARKKPEKQQPPSKNTAQPVYVNRPAVSKPAPEKTQNPFSKEQRARDLHTEERILPIEKKPLVKTRPPVPVITDRTIGQDHMEEKNELSQAIPPAFPDRPVPVSGYSRKKSSPAIQSFLLGLGLATLLGIGIIIGIWISHRGNNASNAMEIAHQAVQTNPTDGSDGRTVVSKEIQPDAQQLIENTPDPDAHEKANALLLEKKKIRIAKQKARDSMQLATNAPVLKADSTARINPVEPKHKNEVQENHNDIKENIVDYIQLSHNKYTVGTFGGIDDLQVTVSNESPFSLDLVVVEVQYIQSNKKIFKRENIYYHDIKSGAAIMQEAPKSQRGVKIQYKITIVNAKASGIAYSDI